MSADISLRKGLSIPLKGQAKKVLETSKTSDNFTLYPDDFHGIVPKMLVKEGEKIALGQPVFFSKANPSTFKVVGADNRFLLPQYRQ